MHANNQKEREREKERQRTARCKISNVFFIYQLLINVPQSLSVSFAVCCAMHHSFTLPSQLPLAEEIFISLYTYITYTSIYKQTSLWISKSQQRRSVDACARELHNEHRTLPWREYIL